MPRNNLQQELKINRVNYS